MIEIYYDDRLIGSIYPGDTGNGTSVKIISYFLTGSLTECDGPLPPVLNVFFAFDKT
jgi:hypothetical protein